LTRTFFPISEPALRAACDRGIGPAFDALPGGHDQIVAETALLVRQTECGADKSHVQTMLRLSQLTVATGSAGLAGIDRNLVANRQVFDPPARLGDGPGELMPHDNRFANPDRAEPAVQKVMQIGTANPAPSDANQNLSGSRSADSLPIDAQISFAI
jgi:hypothetical protein